MELTLDIIREKIYRNRFKQFRSPIAFLLGISVLQNYWRKQKKYKTGRLEHYVTTLLLIIQIIAKF